MAPMLLLNIIKTELPLIVIFLIKTMKVTRMSYESKAI